MIPRGVLTEMIYGVEAFFKAVLGANFICAPFAMKHCAAEQRINQMPPAGGNGENFFSSTCGAHRFLMKPAIDVNTAKNKFAFLRRWLDVARSRRRRCAAISVAR